MPLCTRLKQAPTTFFGYSKEPVKAGESKYTNYHNTFGKFRVVPTYPSPKQRREITTNASMSSFRTSFVIAEDSSESESDESTATNISRAFWRERTLARGHFRVEDSSDSESSQSELVTNLTYSSIPLALPKSKRPQKESYRFNVQGTGAIVCIVEARAGQCWISRLNDTNLHLYHRNGHKKESKSMSTKINMMCIRKDKATLVMPQLSRNLFKMEPSGKMIKFLTFELEIGGFCCTKRNEILLTTTPIQKSHKKGPKPRTIPTVFRISQSGDIIWKIKSKGTDNFVKLSKIEVNINGDICVLDHEPSKEHVVILSPDGEEKNRYYGKHDTVLSHPFGPKDICCDKTGYMYIADLHNSAVHVLDVHGNFHHFLFTEHDGNQFPGAIMCDSGGFLWVGLASGAVRVYKTEPDVNETCSPIWFAGGEGK